MKTNYDIIIVGADFWDVPLHTNSPSVVQEAFCCLTEMI